MKKFLLSVSLAIASAPALLAVPACPRPIVVDGPDGPVSVTLQGDEHFNWARTSSGKTLLRTAGTDRWSEVSSDALSSAASRAKAKRAASQTQIDGTFPATGQRRMLMLLVNYADTKPTYTQADFDNYMNQRGFGGIGSFRDYYLEASYGALDITSTVTRWVTVPGTKSFYGSDGIVRLIMDAMSILDDEIDLNDFDNDGDGVLDGLAIIHQGAGAEASGSSSDIWSHSGTLYGISYDGVELRRYTVQPEVLANTGRQSTIGVMCHEFGHNLGAPDFYDTDYAQSGGEYCGTGRWDLMGSGAWNGDYGDRPAGTNMWQKIQLGWVTPQLLTSATSVAEMPCSTFAPAAYRFDTTVPGEYFILENRQQAGEFDRTIPGHGLLIYHASEDIISQKINDNVVNAAYPQGIYTVCAGAKADPDSDPGSNGWVNTQAAPFPGESGKTSFNDTSLPSTRSVSGRYSYKGLANIAEDEDGLISFDFIEYDAPASPRNFTATASRGIVNLAWEAPDADPAPVCYNIFRNNSLLASVEVPGFTDSSIGSLTDITYNVDAEYANGLISPVVASGVLMPSNRITALDVVTDETSVHLTWDIDTRLTHWDATATNFVRESRTATSVEMAHRFRAADLGVYRGYKISRIAFVPVQSPKEISCQLTVYTADPTTGALSVASQRSVSELGTATWNNTKLTKSVEITGESDIIISVKFIAKDGGNNIQFLTDLGPVVEGFGNLVGINGAAPTADASLTGNLYLYATLTAPATAEDAPLPDLGTVTDPRADAALPLGFAVYRNGERIGESGGRKFTDQAINGTHNYQLTSLYRGGNESAATEPVEVVVNISGAADAAVATDIHIRRSGEFVCIEGYTGTATICNLLGRAVATLKCDHSAQVALPSGVYIVKCGDLAFKVL